MVKNLLANAEDIKRRKFDPGPETSPGGGNGNPLHCSCLENPMDRGICQTTVYRVTQSQILLKQLSMLHP